MPDTNANTAPENTSKQRKKRTPRQLAALFCVFLLLAMYVTAFVVACLDLGDSGRLFAACLVMTIGMPILLWLLLWSFTLMKKRQEDIRPPKQ